MFNLSSESKPTRPKGTWVSHCPNSGKSEMSILTRNVDMPLEIEGCPCVPQKNWSNPQPSLSVGMRCLFIIVIHGPKLFVSSGKRASQKEKHTSGFLPNIPPKISKNVKHGLLNPMAPCPKHYLHVPFFSHPVMASNFITAGLCTCSKEGGQQQQL
jgi:hypothetical protein